MREVKKKMANSINFVDLRNFLLKHIASSNWDVCVCVLYVGMHMCSPMCTCVEVRGQCFYPISNTGTLTKPGAH